MARNDLPPDDRDIYDGYIAAFKLLRVQYEAAIDAGWKSEDAMRLVVEMLKGIMNSGQAK